MKLILLGNDNFTKEILSKLIPHHKVLALVVKNLPKFNKETKGLIEFAKASGIKVIFTSNLKETLPDLLRLRPDKLITASFGMWIPKEVLSVFEVINVHTSLLPKYRGGAPVFWAIYNQEKKTGVSIMKTVAKMDAGPVYRQAAVEITESDNFTILNQKLAETGGNLLNSVLNDLEKNLPVEQAEELVSFAYIPEKKLEKIDFFHSNIKVNAQINANADKPGAYFLANGTIYKVFKAAPNTKTLTPGLIEVSNKRMYIGCLDGSIEILLIQKDGKKLMSAKEFINGNNLDKVKADN